MKVIVENLAKENIMSIFYYNSRYSIKNAIETNIEFETYIDDLVKNTYIGRYIPELSDKRFREIIYRKNRRSGYRIMYYISDISDTIYVVNVLNCKQNFIQFLKLHNYFNNYFNF